MKCLYCDDSGWITISKPGSSLLDGTIHMIQFPTLCTSCETGKNEFQRLKIGDVNNMTYRKSFGVGDKVEKFKGGYTVTGTVIAMGKTKAGAVRYMVEYDAIPGMLHIHSDNDLRLVAAKEESVQRVGGDDDPGSKRSLRDVVTELVEMRNLDTYGWHD